VQSITAVHLYQGGWSGGTARHLEILLPHLAAQGVRAVYAARQGDPGIGRLAQAGVEVVEAFGWGDMAGRLRRAGTSLLHTHGVRAGTYGRFLARVLGVPRVATVHSRLEQDHPSPWRRRVARWLDDPSLREAQAVVVVSQALREDLLTRGVMASRLRVVENAVNPPSSPWTRGELERALALPPGVRVLGSVARHHPVKGLDVLIKAVGRLGKDGQVPPHVCLLAGEGPLTAQLEALAAREAVTDRVRFLGYRPDAPNLVAAWDLLVLPSRAEGFGLAALEAMAAGVAVVASAVGNLPELLDGGRAGMLVPPDDPDALAAALRTLLTDERRRQELAQEGNRRYRERFTPEAMAARTAQVYREVLALAP
jgi:glycosyltransferase involved in cell wall biosynthesis